VYSGKEGRERQKERLPEQAFEENASSNGISSSATDFKVQCAILPKICDMSKIPALQVILRRF
jgi:hypothetical protein